MVNEIGWQINVSFNFCFKNKQFWVLTFDFLSVSLESIVVVVKHELQRKSWSNFQQVFNGNHGTKWLTHKLKQFDRWNHYINSVMFSGLMET